MRVNLEIILKLEIILASSGHLKASNVNDIMCFTMQVASQVNDTLCFTTQDASHPPAAEAYDIVCFTTQVASQVSDILCFTTQNASEDHDILCFTITIKRGHIRAPRATREKKQT